MKKAKRLIMHILKIIRKDEMQILPGQLAFFMVLSIFAIFPVFSLFSGSFINDELINNMDHTLPMAVSSILKSLMEAKTNEFSVILFLFFSLYMASNGCSAMIITSNVLYKIENKNYFKQKIKAFIMTIILINLILFIVIVPAFGDLIINMLMKNYPGKVMDTVSYIFGLLKYPLSFILIYIDVKILYTFAPDDKIPSKYNNLGTLFTTVLWIIITRFYAIYLKHFNTYDIFYGSFGNVVFLLFWVYLLAYVFTLGLAINSERYLERQESVKK